MQFSTQRDNVQIDPETVPEEVPWPVLVADRTGLVRTANDAARRLLPAARPGAALSLVAPRWLAEAHRRTAAGAAGTGDDAPRPGDAGPGTAAPVRGPLGDLHLRAYAAVRPDGGVVWWLLDDTDRHAAETALRAERGRTAFLAEASQVLMSSLNVDRCMEVTARLATRHLADAALVITPPEAGRMTVVRRGPSGTTRTLVRAEPSSLPGLTEALRGFPPVPSRRLDPAAAPDWVLPEGFDGNGGAIAVVPLPGHGLPAGALVLLRRRGHAAFSENEGVVAGLFAARAGAALSAARLYTEQALITETLMRDLLPPRLTRAGGVEYAGRYRAAREGERVGGDFYDVHLAGPGRESLVVMGDVSGKGLEAAVLTGKIRNTLHALLPLADDHRRMLSMLNDALLASGSTRFVTLVLASARRDGGAVELRLTCAGHAPPLIVRLDGRVEEADTRGSLVGMFPEVTATTAEVRLAPGESCLLYTDGITEARGGPLGGTMFGEERLADALAACAGMPCEAIVEHVQMRAVQWAGAGPHDDMAVVAIGAPRGTPDENENASEG